MQMRARMHLYYMHIYTVCMCIGLNKYKLLDLQPDSTLLIIYYYYYYYYYYTTITTTTSTIITTTTTTITYYN